MVSGSVVVGGEEGSVLPRKDQSSLMKIESHPQNKTKSTHARARVSMNAGLQEPRGSSCSTRRVAMS